MKDSTKSASELTDAARKNYEHAVRTGLKFQEEAGRVWSSMLNQATPAQDWQKWFANVTGMATSLLPMTQRRLEDMLALMEQNSRTGAELMRKAVEAVQAPGLSESQDKWLDFWTSSMGAVRSNTEAVTEISNKALDSWIHFVRKNTDFSEFNAGKSA